MEKFQKYNEILEKILKNAQLLMINTDKNIQNNIENIPNVITYGINQKAIVTVSSISETDILVYWQKNLQDKEGNKLEIEERRIKKKDNLKNYEILIIYTLFRIYQKDIMGANIGKI